MHLSFVCPSVWHRQPTYFTNNNKNNRRFTTIPTTATTRLLSRQPYYRYRGSLFWLLFASSEGEWIKHSVKLDVQVPRELAFDTYSNLEKMPNWSPWLKSVQVDPKQPEFATWYLAARGLTVSWRSRNTRVERPIIVAWESIQGLPNRGSVQFFENNQHSTQVQLTVEYRVPRFLKVILSSAFVGKFVENTLLEDLKRFRQYVVREYNYAAQKNKNIHK
jgi:uncharacterized membrane protein